MPEITQRTTAFETPWFEVVAKCVRGVPGVEADATYFAVVPRDYVTVLAVTKGDEIVLVRQYRPAVEHYTLELPSGHLDAGESPLEAARRELLEETGYRADILEPLGKLIPDTGRLANSLWCYYAPSVVRDDRPHSPEVGVETILCTRGDLVQKIQTGQFNHALHLAVILLAFVQSMLPLGRGSDVHTVFNEVPRHVPG